MLKLSDEVSIQILQIWSDDPTATKNGPAHTLSLFFKTLGWTKRPDSWICDRVGDTPFDFLHPSNSFALQEINRSMNFQLTTKTTTSRKDLADLRGKHINIDATTCLYPENRKFHKSAKLDDLKS